MKPQTVAELIELLQKYPKDAKVFVDGYEGGVQVVGKVDYVSVWPESRTYCGTHETNAPYDDPDACPSEMVVLLSRRSY
jgi:hypothetical protein